MSAAEKMGCRLRIKIFPCRTSKSRQIGEGAQDSDVYSNHVSCHAVKGIQDLDVDQMTVGFTYLESSCAAAEGQTDIESH